MSGYVPKRKYDFVNPKRFISIWKIFNSHNPILSCGCKFFESIYGITHELCKSHEEARKQCEKCEFVKLTDKLENFGMDKRNTQLLKTVDEIKNNMPKEN